MSSHAPSPPTRRVIAVMGLLAGADRPLTTTQIATALDISRATATAVLHELELAEWVRRDHDLAYATGPGFARLARTDDRLPQAAAVLAELAKRTGCGVTMSDIGSDALVVVAKQHGGARVIPGIPLGIRIPLAFPAGAAVMPWRSKQEQQTWLTTSEHGGRAGAAVLKCVRSYGVSVFRPRSDDAGLVDVLADVLDVVGGELHNAGLRRRVLAQLADLTSRPYTAAELESADALPVSYLGAPVFTAPGVARYEIQLGPLRSAVPKPERDAYIAALKDAAATLSAS